MSVLLGVYGAAGRLLHPTAAPLLLQARVRRGKEEPARLHERLGRPRLPRPEGSVMWLHAASVGELMLALAMGERLRALRPDAALLVTTMTTASARLAAGRLRAPDLHQYAPIDTPQAVEGFLQHWRPDAGVFFESELWPGLLGAARRGGVPVALVNARMSARSLRAWARWPAAARTLLEGFAFVQAADTATAQGLAALGASVLPDPANLKLAAAAAAAPPADLAAQIGPRPCWIAASTHPGEEEIVLGAHAVLRARRPEALLLLAPRHPERGAEAARLAGGAPRRAEGDAIGDAAVFVLDSIGELAQLFAVAPAALIAGSLTPAGRGHNPCEALAQGARVISGRRVSSFADVYAALDAAGAVHWVDNAQEIAAAVEACWDAPNPRDAEAGADLRARALRQYEGVLARVAALPPIRGRAHAPA
jgi:3-deoxy-D-manno-octulosonic-acid transferase